VLLDGLRNAFGDRLVPLPSSAGLHVSALAANHGGTPARGGLILGFGALDEAGIRARTGHR
jgi:hypothetical protein